MNAGLWSVLSLIICIITIFFITSRYKANAFITMLFVAFLFGFINRINPVDMTDAIKTGFGAIFEKTGLLYISGIIMSVILEKTGATISIATSLINVLGHKRLPLSATISGYIISIPINCDSGFVILSPVTKSISSRTGISLVMINTALACGLYATHTIVPPTAGPTAVAKMLNADIGLVILLGVVVALLSSICGFLTVTFLNRNHKKSQSELVEEPVITRKLPSFAHSILPIIYPIIMISLNSICSLSSKPLGGERFVKLIGFLGDPVIALLSSVLIALTLVPKSSIREALDSWIDEALKYAAPIILINSAAGAFANMLVASPMVNYIQSNIPTLKSGIVIPFIIAAIFKTAQGSSTVAMVTTSVIIAPIISTINVNPVLCTLAISAGSMLISHTNDSYFWVVTQLTGMDVKTAFKYYTIPTAVTGISAFAIVLLLSIIIK